MVQITQVASRLPAACRQVLSNEADAILEIVTLVPLDRRDLDAAWNRAHRSLEALASASAMAPPTDGTPATGGIL
jgi:hypothetical protein